MNKATPLPVVKSLENLVSPLICISFIIIIAINNISKETLTPIQIPTSVASTLLALAF